MKHRSRLLLLSCLAVAGLLAAAGQARAIIDDRSDPTDSLEWLIAHADVVVRGTIVDIPGLAESDGLRQRQVKIQVAETLKGVPQETVSFLVSYPLSTWYSLLIHPMMQEVVVLLVKDARSSIAGPGQAGGWRAAALLVCSKAGHVNCLSHRHRWMRSVVTMDLRVLTNWDDVLAAVRIGSRDSGPIMSPQEVLLQAPTYAENDSPLCKSGCLPLRVPRDRRLQDLAQRWLQSDDVGLRGVACQLLREFGLSAESVASLQRVLDDPYHVVLEERVERWPYDPRRWLMGDSVAYEVRWYPIREAAYETLVQGGVSVRKPTIRERTFGWLERTLRWGSFGIGAVVLLVLAMLAGRRLLRAPRVREEGCC